MNKPFVDNTPENIDDQLIDYIMRTLKCFEIGIIQSFNPATSLAVVQVARKEIRLNVEAQQIFDIAPLIDIPVLILSGIGGGVQFPIKAGDECVLLYLDRDITSYILNKIIAVPNTARTHDKLDVVAIICKVARGNYNNAQTSVSFGGNNLTLIEGNATFSQDLTVTGNLTVNGTLTINGVKLEGGGKLKVEGKEVAVVGGVTAGSPTTQKITESGQ